MDPIKNLNGVLQEYQRIDREKGLKKSLDTSKLQGGSSTSSEETKVSTSAAAQDSVVISEDSRNLFDKEVEVKQYVQELEQIKTIDDKQMAKIKYRLESGYYNEPAVMEKIMHDIMISSPLPVSNIVDINEESTSAVKQKADELVAIKEKIQNNEYSSDKVMSAVANKILGIE